MNFVYPQFLFGLFALGIPIIIHLFNFRRTRKIYFSNNQFLKNVKETTTSKLKVKHLLILLARLLFIFFLVATFAQPFIPGTNQNAGTANSERTVYVYLDNSQSMSSELASNSRGIDLGIKYITEITNLYPQNTQYKLLTNDFGSFSRVPKSKNELQDFVTELRLSGAFREIQEVNSKILNDFQNVVGASSEVMPDVYWISDFQKSTAGNLSNVETDSSLQINIIPISSSYQSNVFVDSIYLVNPFMLADGRNELQITMRNDGADPVEDMIVRLIINGQQVANASANIAANSTSKVNFNLNFPLANSNQCQLVFEDYPVTFDNDFYFTLNLGEKINVMEIRSGNLGSNGRKTTIGSVYANQEVFNFSSYSIDNMDYSQIATANLLIFNEIPSGGIQGAIIPYIQDFLENGGHVIFIPPVSGDLSFFQNVLGTGAFQNNIVQVNDTVQNDIGLQAVPLANLDLANPFFTDMFESENERFQMPNARRLVNASIRGEALLKYETGEPYLLAVSNSQIRTPLASSNQVYLFSTPIRESYTNLFRHAVFVPVMYRLASLSKSLDKKLYYQVNETTLELNTTDLGVGADLLDPDNSTPLIYEMQQGTQKIIPIQRTVGNRLLLEVPQDLLKTGFYQLKVSAEGGSNAQDTTTLQQLAFDYSKRESLIAQYSEEELTAIFENRPNIRIFDAADVDTFSKTLETEQNSLALWKYALMLALLFLLTEILLIRFL